MLCTIFYMCISLSFFVSLFLKNSIVVLVLLLTVCQTAEKGAR